MRAIDVANAFIARHGDEVVLSNLSLNKLVYFAQVESLRATGEPLFSDRVEAWGCGPVEPSVYHAFKSRGSGRVTVPLGPVPSDPGFVGIVDRTFFKYGMLTAYDLVSLAHREGGAWKRAFVPGRDAEITPDGILASSDGMEAPEYSGTLASGIKQVNDRWPNAFELLRDASYCDAINYGNDGHRPGTDRGDAR